MPIYGTVLIFPDIYIKNVLGQRVHASANPCYNLVAVTNASGHFKIFTALYFPPGCDSVQILNEFQLDLEDLALS